MSKKVQLQIKNPCPQQWEQMTPEKEGRFCASCSKIVVDFTTMDDQEILSWLTRNHKNTCGRFTAGQLDRPLDHRPEKKRSRWQYWAYLLAGLLFSSEISAQTLSTKPQTSLQTPSDTQRQLLTGDTTIASRAPTHPDSVRVQLLDDNGNPVSFASVITGNQKRTISNADGSLSIALKDLIPGQYVTISAIGYEPLRIKAKKLLAADAAKVVTMKMSIRVMGDLIIVGTF